MAAMREAAVKVEAVGVRVAAAPTGAAAMPDRVAAGTHAVTAWASMDGGKEEMIMQLEELKQDAPSQKIMQRIDDLISELERD